MTPDHQVTPTNIAPSVILDGEDYGLKASINDSNWITSRFHLLVHRPRIYLPFSFLTPK
jgi:hypothetical protein